MKCADRFIYTHAPCNRPAKFMVIAPAAPKVVCGYHARQFLKRALIPLKLFGQGINVDQIPDINGFLGEMEKLGALVSIGDATISIKLGGEIHGKRVS